MPKSITGKLACGIRMMALVIAIGMPVAFAQQYPPANQETVLTFVHDFLQVFYPELVSKGHTLKLCVEHPADDAWREISGVYFTITPEKPSGQVVRQLADGGTIPEVIKNPDIILLDGSMWLWPLKHGGLIKDLHSSYTAAIDLKYRTFCDLVESHPEWTDAQAILALKQAGARFGPDEKKALINSLPMRDAERFFGTLRITSVEFTHLEGEHVGSFAAGAFDWRVRTEVQSPDGTKVEYAFRFEPFEGKLHHLLRVGS